MGINIHVNKKKRNKLAIAILTCAQELEKKISDNSISIISNMKKIKIK